VRCIGGQRIATGLEDDFSNFGSCLLFDLQKKGGGEDKYTLKTREGSVS
jgi:hypothetical protein